MVLPRIDAWLIFVHENLQLIGGTPHIFRLNYPNSYCGRNFPYPPLFVIVPGQHSLYFSLYLWRESRD